MEKVKESDFYLQVNLFGESDRENPTTAFVADLDDDFKCLILSRDSHHHTAIELVLEIEDRLEFLQGLEALQSNQHQLFLKGNREMTPIQIKIILANDSKEHAASEQR